MDDLTELVKFVTALLVLVTTIASILSEASGSDDREEDEKGR